MENSLLSPFFLKWSQHWFETSFVSGVRHYNSTPVHTAPRSPPDPPSICHRTPDPITLPPPPPPLVTPNLSPASASLFSVYFLLSVCFAFVFYVPLVSDVVRYLSFSVWLVSLSISSSRSAGVVTNGRTSHSFRRYSRGWVVHI